MSLLTDRQLQDEAWIVIRLYEEKRLIDLRRQNDNPALGEIETAVLRGRIAECKKTLSLGEPKPAIDED